MRKTIISILVICLLVLIPVIQGCNNTGEDTETPEPDTIIETEDDTTTFDASETTQAETELPGDSGPFGGDGYVQGRYLVNSFRPGAPLSDRTPLLQIDLENGNVLTVCPIENCTHDGDSPDCIYNTAFTVNSVCEGGGYILFTLYDSHSIVNTVKMYIFDVLNNSLKFVREVRHADTPLVYGGGMFYFEEKLTWEEMLKENIPSTDLNTVKLYKIDPKTCDETLLTRITPDERIYDYSDGYLVTRMYFSQFFYKISVNEPYEKTRILTPDGKDEFSTAGYMYKYGGIAVDYGKPAIYLYDTAQYLNIPVSCRITCAQRTGKTVVFQTVSGDAKYVKTGIDDSGKETSAYVCDPVIYFVDENGNYEAYEVGCDYVFYVNSVYGHKVFARSDVRLVDGNLINDGSERYLLIDLDTKDATVYDFENYNVNGNGKEIHTEKLSLTVNKLH